MTGICKGRIAIVTGAGRGIGREHAMELARQGAKVVVNDLGGAKDGSGADASAAQAVVDEIVALGGSAVANHDDVADWNGAKSLITQAVEAFGDLHILVNNAGIIRDRTIASMSEQEWDAVIRVHLRGTAAPTRFAAEYWRAQTKERGEPVDARLINTVSASGLFHAFGQSNYGAAKAGIAAFTGIAAKELAAYGVTANAIAPNAVTRLTESIFPAERAEELSPKHVAPLVAWLASPESKAITGRIFVLNGARIGVAETWRVEREIAKEGLWSVDELGREIPGLVASAAPNADIHGRIRAGDSK